MLVHKYSQSAQFDEADHKCFLMVMNFHIHNTGCFELLHIYFIKALNNVYTKFSIILVAWASEKFFLQPMEGMNMKYLYLKMCGNQKFYMDFIYEY